MSICEVHATFLEGSKGRLFAVARKPPSLCEGVLLVPPFAEEMNKSRHVFTEIAVCLAERGIGSVLVDLYGTGDSEGEFAAADWSVWTRDLAVAFRWANELGMRTNRLLAVRLGCALAVQAAMDNDWKIERSILIQPVLSGARSLDQFLRIRVAASLMQSKGKETIAELRARLKAGETLEVAGYDISSTLAAQLDAVDLLATLSRTVGSINWIELLRTADMPPSTPSMNAISRAREFGIDVELVVVQGEPFWSSVEIVRIPDLVDRVVAALRIGI